MLTIVLKWKKGKLRLSPGKGPARTGSLLWSGSTRWAVERLLPAGVLGSAERAGSSAPAVRDLPWGSQPRTAREGRDSGWDCTDCWQEQGGC